MFENIDFTAIQLQPTPKPACIFKCTEHIVEEESPKDLNYKLGDIEEYHILEEPLSQRNCVDLNSVGGDEIVKHANEREASNNDKPPNPNCGNESHELKNVDHATYDYNPGKAIDVSHVFTTDEVST